MGKQYISTVNASNAHRSDIFGVAITPKYTITVSSDGYAKFWDNKQDELTKANDIIVRSVFVDKSGIHHLAVYENRLPSSTKKVTIVAFACFNGSIYFKYFVDDDFATMQDVGFKLEQSWVPGFYVDPENKQDFFLVNKMNGATAVYLLKVTDESADDAVTIKFEKYGDLEGNSGGSFPISLAVNQTENRKCAVGYIDGSVLLYDFQTSKLVYTFKSTDLVVSTNPKLQSSTSVPRVLAFSPGGTLLAVGRDNQAAGSITLYDVQYGENVGTLSTPAHSANIKGNGGVVGGFAHQGWIMGLDFDESGKHLVSCGFDKCVRVWDLDTREREATINLSVSDFDDGVDADEHHVSVASGVKFIKKGVRGGAGSDSNEGICVVSFDRGVRWYREAGGI
ncbi:uncharacterized protein LODBEIA_P52990 [Lodderomyces beijingensis]|uniref:Anaphase-promoting complex subunit 4 WD40 domain-containing protein n=1 Tax=Lodderomyces beijingensis TaxID=1775926 RepID=A0ABP0ZV32_9ASCO